jgi:GAF domain-containing protein
VALLDEKRERFTVIVLDRPRPEVSAGTTLPLATTACSADVLAGRPHLTPDLTAESEFPGEQQLYQAGYRSRINLPLRVGARVLGALNLAWSQPAGYCEASLALLGQIADAVALALERGRLFDETRRSEAAEREQRALAEALRDTAAALSSTLSFDEVLDRILANVGRVVPHDAATMMLIEPFDSRSGFGSRAEGVARVVRCRGHAERGVEAAVMALRFPLATTRNLRYMAETGLSSVILDTETHPGWVGIPELRWIRSYVGAPIRIKGQVIGFLNLDSTTPGFFTLDHAKRLEVFADQAGIAIENARLYDEIRRYAADLERRVVERTAELSQREVVLSETAARLQTANEQLKELDQLKSRFVANVSHELRTPLANIKTLLYLLEKGKPDKRS